MENFCSLRMVGDYERLFYIPIFNRMTTLLDNNVREAANLARLEDRVRALWAFRALWVHCQGYTCRGRLSEMPARVDLLVLTCLIPIANVNVVN
ncbi:MAG: hypothetical protein QM498_01620 [Desulfobacterium sp.]